MLPVDLTNEKPINCMLIEPCAIPKGRQWGSEGPNQLPGFPLPRSGHRALPGAFPTLVGHDLGIQWGFQRPTLRQVPSSSRCPRPAAAQGVHRSRTFPRCGGPSLPALPAVIASVSGAGLPRQPVLSPGLSTEKRHRRGQCPHVPTRRLLKVSSPGRHHLYRRHRQNKDRMKRKQQNGLSCGD